jgi:hypothetical protein
MKHIIKQCPNHVWNLDGSKLTGEVAAAQERREYLHRLEIPHLLNSDPRLGKVKQGIVTMIVPFDLPIEAGDVLADEYKWEAIVVDIQERRPAMGSWSHEHRPHFVKVKYL